jgi:hypothetical protein|tara:strand:- start:68 stop:292 length:225 start_codon:yes stop_codon:yes gene_type:complete
LIELISGMSEWLLNDFPKYQGKTLRSDVKDAYTKAETIISGVVTLPDCDCQYGSYQNKINKLYEQWLLSGQNTK